ncbi:MAG: hypothetical protein ABFD54_11360 [Armatimonadota bacterium]
MAREDLAEAERIADFLLEEASAADDEEYPAYAEAAIGRRERDRAKRVGMVSLQRISASEDTVAGIAPMGALMVAELAESALKAVCSSCRLSECETECVQYRIQRGLTPREIAEIVPCSRETIRQCLSTVLPLIYNHPTFWTYTVIAEECHLPPNVIKAICENW